MRRECVILNMLLLHITCSIDALKKIKNLPLMYSLIFYVITEGLLHNDGWYLATIHQYTYGHRYKLYPNLQYKIGGSSKEHLSSVEPLMRTRFI
jgi:hypothetical protein